MNNKYQVDLGRIQAYFYTGDHPHFSLRRITLLHDDSLAAKINGEAIRKNR